MYFHSRQWSNYNIEIALVEVVVDDILALEGSGLLSPVIELFDGLSKLTDGTDRSDVDKFRRTR